ncbi:MAG: 3-keto-disaccharide hydrolase [Verrucomicrobiales bacterium]
MNITRSLAAIALLSLPTFAEDKKADEGFKNLTDGKSMAGWKVTKENPGSFKLVDGAFVANGPRAHLFYVGDERPFKDFVLRLAVMTKANSNGGIYIHTKYQAEGWPVQGHEAQVNNSFKPDPRKTGSIYRCKDIMNTSPVGDDKWFEYEIKVEGKKITISLDGKVVNEWSEPESGATGVEPGRRLGEGTFGLQAHDPGSTIYYKNIRVKRLN